VARRQLGDDLRANVVAVTLVVGAGVAETDREKVGGPSGARAEQRA
jgi:hypothetical protein